jgi:hypothetical protein
MIINCSDSAVDRDRYYVDKDIIYIYLGMPWEKSRAGDKIEKNEMGGACSADGGGERCVQGFGGES